MKRFKSFLKNNIYVLPLCLIVLIVPLIIHLKVISTDNIPYNSWIFQTNNYDIFSYCKRDTLVYFSLFGTILFYIKYKYNSLIIKRLHIYIPIITYIFFVFISTLLSEYKVVSILGFPDRYEGAGILFIYMVLVFLSINLYDSEDNIKLLIFSLYASMFLIGTIGILQFFGVNLLDTYWGKIIMIPTKYQNVRSIIKFNFGKYNIFSTLYNPNYVGSYTSLIFPIFVCFSILSKNKLFKVLSISMSILTYVNLIGCNSRAAIIGTLFSIVILILLLNKQLIQNWIICVILVFSMLTVTLFMNEFSNGYLLNNIVRTKNEFATDSSKISKTGSILKDITCEQNTISIDTTINPIIIEKQNSTIYFKNKNGLLLNTRISDNIIKITNENYEDYTFIIEKSSNRNYFKIEFNEQNINFLISNNGFQFINQYGIIDTFYKPKTFGFTGKESWGSVRGYIWSRTIPLIKNTILYGYGPDTFSIYFPQRDYIGKLKAYGTYNIVVDKPHNMYLQIAVNTGILSLISILFLFGMYIISSVKTYMKANNDNIFYKLGLGIFCGFVGYIITGIFNDSVVSVAPVFWILFGCGIGINEFLGKNKL